MEVLSWLLFRTCSLITNGIPGSFSTVPFISSIRSGVDLAKLFITVPVGFWEEATSIRKYFDWLSPRLGMKEWTDWYNLKLEGRLDMPLSTP